MDDEDATMMENARATAAEVNRRARLVSLEFGLRHAAETLNDAAFGAAGSEFEAEADRLYSETLALWEKVRESNAAPLLVGSGAD